MKTKQLRHASGLNIHEENRGSLRLVGIAARTRNKDELDGLGKIPALWQRFFQENIAAQIPGQKRPGEILAGYAEFESDETGAYTIVIGADVDSSAAVPEGMTCLEIPASRYRVVSTERGKLSEVGIDAWMKIWKDPALKASRTYRADLEIYGADAADPENARFDIWLGVAE